MWGLTIPATKLGLVTIPPLTLTALRFALAVPLLMLLLIGRKCLPWKAVPAVAALGIIGIGVGQVAQTFGVTGTSASAGTIISATIPVFVVPFAALRLRQAISRVQRLGVAAAFAGIVVVALGNSEAGVFQTTIGGPLWMLVSALAVAFYYVWSVELTERYGTVVVAAWSTVFGFAAVLGTTSRTRSAKVTSSRPLTRSVKSGRKTGSANARSTGIETIANPTNATRNRATVMTAPPTGMS